MGFLIRILGVDLIREILIDLYHWFKHRKQSKDLCSHNFFPLMEREMRDEIPFFIIKMANPNQKDESIKLRQELFNVFFPIKVKIFNDKIRNVCVAFKEKRFFAFQSKWIMEWCYLYNGEAERVWRELGNKNNAMAIFVKKFHEIHLPNIIKTQERVKYILEKDISEYEKLDQILDTLYWAFKLSLPSVLNASRELNGDLTCELKKR